MQEAVNLGWDVFRVDWNYTETSRFPQSCSTVASNYTACLVSRFTSTYRRNRRDMLEPNKEKTSDGASRTPQTLEPSRFNHFVFRPGWSEDVKIARQNTLLRTWKLNLWMSKTHLWIQPPALVSSFILIFRAFWSGKNFLGHVCSWCLSTLSHQHRSRSVFKYDAHSPFHRVTDTEEGVTTASWGTREKFERRRKRKRWVMNYRADHFRLGPGKERERDSPPILPCSVWYARSHWGERFMANLSGSNIPRKATSGSIATILAGHINPLLYVVLSVQ